MAKKSKGREENLTTEEERILEKLEADRAILDEVFEEMEANRERYEAEYAAARAEFEEGEKKRRKRRSADAMEPEEIRALIQRWQKRENDRERW
ncbi:hypothetical protein IKF27_01720 [Candidatus Saccharibacteria bacterium]|nr:hypothetical protein [Candidatus Saccharibacteria bacterium]